MKTGDLTTLANVKAWLATTTYATVATSTDAMLASLISRESQGILAYLERPYVLPKVYVNEAYDGKGGNRQFLRNWPVTSVQQVAINGVVIPYSPWVPGDTSGNVGYGYTIEFDAGDPPGSPQSIELLGLCFWPGNQNVQISYKAGYQISNESHIIPVPSSGATTSEVTVDQPYGIWGSDVSVTYADGTSLVPVNNTPTVAGTYQVLATDKVITENPITYQPPGVYVFYQDDMDKSIQITYGYVPAALEQVAIELICERWVYRTRIGESTRTIGQQVSAKYDLSEIPAYARPTLQRYRSILPL